MKDFHCILTWFVLDIIIEAHQTAWQWHYIGIYLVYMPGVLEKMGGVRVDRKKKKEKKTRNAR